MKKIILLSCLLAGVVACSAKVDASRVATLAAEQCKIMDKSLSDTRMPKTFKDGELITSKLSWWCSGFYPGVCWYTYKLGKDESMKELALKQTAKMLNVKALNRQHDIGFQMQASVLHAYDETGDSLYLPVIREAAELLASRFSPVTGTIKSWDNKRYTYPVIIDNMMNLELLTYASRLFGVPEWKEMAITHARTTMKNHFRDDYSSYHVVDYNPEDGSIIAKKTHQGYADESAWARGQAWGLYGFTMMFRETGEEDFLRQAEGIASFLMPKLSGRPVPAWDFDAPKESIGQDDASAAAIMASAFLELGHLTGKKEYVNQAKTILKALGKSKYLCTPGECGGFILKHSTGNYPKNGEVDVPLTYADYYYMEALYRFGTLFITC